MLNNMVTDRDNGDRAHWLELHEKNFDDMTASEQTEWLDGLKGAYKASDMNRVEDAVDTLQTYINGAVASLQTMAQSLGVAWDDLFDLDFETLSLTIKDDWADGDSITIAQGKRYIDNIKAICEAVGITYTGPEALASLTIVGANILEQLLIDVDDEATRQVTEKENLITLASEYVIYSDEIYGGEA